MSSMRKKPSGGATRISSSTLQRQIGTVTRRVAQGGEHIVVERDGFPVMALIPMAAYQRAIQARRRAQSPARHKQAR